MEGSESEAIFESLNLNPRLFINEVLNTVDDLVESAFNYYLKEASTLLKTEGTDRADDLSKGVAGIRNMIHAVLDKRLGMWEKYCLRHCFAVPEGFSLPKTSEAPGDNSIEQDAFLDPELDAQLDTLRNKLTLVGKESVELNRELRSLEKQSLSNKANNRNASSIAEALQFYEQSSVHDMLQEMITSASELRTKVEKLKAKSRQEIEQARAERIGCYLNKDLPLINHNKGLFKAQLEDLHEFMTRLESK